MDGNVIAALILGAIAWGGAISLGVMRFKPSHADVEEIADSRIIAHQDEISKLLSIKLKADTAGFAERLGGVVSTLEAVAEAAYPDQSPCNECGSVFVTAVMQHVRGFVEWRDQRDPDYINDRRESAPIFYCPAHTKPYEIAARQQYRYSYGHTINEERDWATKRDRLPLWRYYNVVPAQAERWDEVVVPAEPVKVKVKRGRKSAADRLREATARGEDPTTPTTEVPSTTRRKRTEPVNKGGENPEPIALRPAPEA